ncbi:MAG: amidohydrolase family protein [Clostridia bacterium]|nr:amidohydrolase family protein [Clostridia bacterium]
MIIDFHTHTFPDAIAEKAVAKLSAKSRSRAFTGGTAGELKAAMERAGIRFSVVLPVATNPEKVGKMNDVTIAANGHNGLIYFGCIHPDGEHIRQEIKRLAFSGIRGLKIHPAYQGVDADDLRFLRILEAAGEEDLCVVAHAGDDIGFPGAKQSAPEKFAHALEEVGSVKLILAHMGGWKNWDRVAPLFANSSVMLDTSFSLGEIPYPEEVSEEEKALLSDEAFCKLVRAIGADRILFGTDSPWTGQQESLKAVQALPLTQDEKQMILGKNAEKLLKI